MKTCYKNKSYIYKINGSKFETYSFFVENINETLKIINDIKKDNRKAKHVCYAYKINDISKYDDDGEPQGSSGKKILDVINISNLNYILIIIVRYMSGSKLGLGLLTSSYYNSALQVCNDIDNLTKIQIIDLYQIECEIDKFNAILNELIKSNEIIIDKIFLDNKCNIYTTLNDSLKNKFNAIFYKKYLYKNIKN